MVEMLQIKMVQMKTTMANEDDKVENELNDDNNNDTTRDDNGNNNNDADNNITADNGGNNNDNNNGMDLIRRMIKTQSKKKSLTIQET